MRIFWNVNLWTRLATSRLLERLLVDLNSNINTDIPHYIINSPSRVKTFSQEVRNFPNLSEYITEISKVLTARLGIQNAQSHLINRFQNSLKSRGQKS